MPYVWSWVSLFFCHPSLQPPYINLTRLQLFLYNSFSTHIQLCGLMLNLAHYDICGSLRSTSYKNVVQRHYNNFLKGLECNEALVWNSANHLMYIFSYPDSIFNFSSVFNFLDFLFPGCLSTADSVTSVNIILPVSNPAPRPFFLA